MSRRIVGAMVLIAATSLMMSSSHAAPMPQALQQSLKGLPVENKGGCTFKPDMSDPVVPCIVLDGGERWFVIVGTVVNGSFHPIEVKAISKTKPDEQATVWRDPDSII